MAEMKDRLRIVPEFRPDEYERYTNLLFGRLERRLKRWEPEQVELELSVKDREKPAQRTVLECWITGVPHMVGTSNQNDLDKAVVEVRDDIHRQVNRYVTRREAERKSGGR